MRESRSRVFDATVWQTLYRTDESRWYGSLRPQAATARSRVSSDSNPFQFRALRPQIKRHDFTIPDIKITTEAPVRAPSSVPVDDAVLPFEVAALDLRGRLTRLGPALDDILTKHDYPARVGKLLGEAIVLTTLLGSSLKFDGRFILQTQTDGPVSFLIVDFQAPDRLRAYARFDAKRLEGRPGFRRAARQGPSCHDHRSGRRT